MLKNNSDVEDYVMMHLNDEKLNTRDSIVNAFRWYFGGPLINPDPQRLSDSEERNLLTLLVDFQIYKMCL